MKTWPKYFELTIKGKKPFELRFNDRNFHLDDQLLLQEYSNGEYTGRECLVKTMNVIDMNDLFLGYVAIIIEVIEIREEFF